MAEATNTTLGTITLTGDLDGSAQTPSLRATGVLPGTYNVANLVVNNKGLVVDVVQGDPEILPCATTGECGLVVVGDNITVNSGQISIPYATTSHKGVVKVGSGFRIDGCVLEVDHPKATTTTLGTVIVPESGNIDIDGSGNISVPVSSVSTLGLIKSGSTTQEVIITSGTANLSYPVATTLVLGTVKRSNDFSVDGSGVLSYSGPVTSEIKLGLMRVGNGLDVDVNGLVWVDPTEITFPVATEASKGIMQVGSGLLVSSGVVSVDPSGVSLPIATESTKGAIQVGNGLDVSSGIVTVDPTEILATSGVAGCVIAGTNINLSAGTISISTATNTGTKGVLTVTPSVGLTLVSGALSGTNASTGGTKGVVSIGSNINVTGGVISVSQADTSGTKGILTVTAGDGLSLTSGTLSGTNASTGGVKGFVSIGSNFVMTTGVLSVPDGTSTGTKGVFSFTPNTGITETAGVISGTVAASGVKGMVSIGSNITVSSGTISLKLSNTSATLGLIKSGNTSEVEMSNGVLTLGTVMIRKDQQSVCTASQQEQIAYNWTSAGHVLSAYAQDVLDFNTETVTTESLSYPTKNNEKAATQSQYKGFVIDGPYEGFVVLNFPSNTTSYLGTQLPHSQSSMAGVSSSTKGYYGGGYASSDVQAYIDGINFSGETTFSLAATLSLARDQLAGVNSSTKGYFAGGRYTGLTSTTEIDGVDFGSETAINPGATLATAKNGFVGVTSSTRGYFGGGNISATVTPSSTSEIDGIRYDTEAAINPSAALSVARYSAAGVNSTTRGYWCGGTQYTGTRTSRVDGIQFDTETAINLGNVLGNTRSAPIGVSANDMDSFDAYFSSSQTFKISVGANTTINLLDYVNGQSAVLIVVQDPTGGHSVSFVGATFVTSPTIDTSSGGITVIEVVTTDGKALARQIY